MTENIKRSILDIFKEYNKKKQQNKKQDINELKIETLKVEKQISSEKPQTNPILVLQQKQEQKEKGIVYDFVESTNFNNYNKFNISNKAKLKTEENMAITETIFKDEEDNVDIINRTINKSLGEYKIEEIKISDFENNISRKILMSSYLGTIPLKNRFLKDIYYEIKKTVKNYYKQEEINDVGNSSIKVSYFLLKELTYKLLTPLFFDPFIEDINGVENENLVIYYTGKLESGENLSGDYITNIEIKNQQMNEIIQLLIERGNSKITKQDRVAFVTLPTADSARFTAIYPYESGGNMAFSIRKQVYNLIPPNMFVKNKTATADALAYIAWAMDHVNTGKMAVVGLPAAGKTTFLKTISLFIPETSRIFSIETTPELQLFQKSWTRQIQVTDAKQQTALINASLMFRPDFMIVGEVKFDKDLVDALFSVISSGEKTLFTFHATSPSSFISKFQARSLEISKDRLSNMSYLLFVVLDPTTHIRYLASIDEIYGYDDENDKILWKNLTTMRIKEKTSGGFGKKKEYTLVYDTKFVQSGDKYISYDIYNKFVDKCNLRIEKDGSGYKPDQLLLMILNSELLKEYVYIHNQDLEIEYAYDENEKIIYPLTYWKTYKEIYNEMNAIKNFLLIETQNNVNADEFIKDFNNFKNTGILPELKVI
jgi:type IV secretory pathway ATPase VirB11/archaellum biosynthesis ATPase